MEIPLECYLCRVIAEVCLGIVHEVVDVVCEGYEDP